MYRSTTPTLVLNIKNEDFDMSTIDVCHVTIESKLGTQRKIYEEPEIDEENRRIIVSMTQEETKIFNVGTVKIQIKIKLVNGAVISSKMITALVKETLEEEELWP